jgi:DNA-binding PadR family transcriptional regulator
MYGYEIKRQLIERLAGYIDVHFGSIYYALKMAEKNGWIQVATKQKAVAHPERLIYQITPEGIKYYKRGVRNYFDQTPLHFEIDSMLLFLNELSKEQKTQFKEDSIASATERLASIKNNQINESLRSYIESHLKAELVWLRTL